MCAFSKHSERSLVTSIAYRTPLFWTPLFFVSLLVFIHFTVGQCVGGRWKSSVMPEKCEKIRDCVANNPRISVRRLSPQVGMSRTTTHCTLRALKLKHCRISVQYELKPTDPTKQIAYCTCFKIFTHNGASHLNGVYFSGKAWV